MNPIVVAATRGDRNTATNQPNGGTMNTIRALTAVAAIPVAAILAGCAGTSSTEPPPVAASTIPGVTPAATSGTSPAAPTVAQVAAQIGATGVTAIDPTLYASHEGGATWHGQSVDIATFATDELRNKWEAAAKEFGPILTDGHDYAVTTG